MAHYYTSLRDGETKAEALRRAKLDFLASGDRESHPYFWAPFVLAGPALGPLPESVTWAELWGLVALGFVGLAAILFTL